MFVIFFLIKLLTILGRIMIGPTMTLFCCRFFLTETDKIVKTLQRKKFIEIFPAEDYEVVLSFVNLICWGTFEFLFYRECTFYQLVKLFI